MNIKATHWLVAVKVLWKPHAGVGDAVGRMSVLPGPVSSARPVVDSQGGWHRVVEMGSWRGAFGREST